MMITKRTIYPGQPGSKKWQKIYGDTLLCVRYKYDSISNRKMISVELIAEESEWHKNVNHIPKNKIVSVKINYGETELGKKARALGGFWDRKNKVWRIPMQVAVHLGITDRIVNNS